LYGRCNRCAEGLSGPGCGGFSFISLQLAVGSWQLAVGSWQLAVD